MYFATDIAMKRQRQKTLKGNNDDEILMPTYWLYTTIDIGNRDRFSALYRHCHSDFGRRLNQNCIKHPKYA